MTFNNFLRFGMMSIAILAMSLLVVSCGDEGLFGGELDGIEENGNNENGYDDDDMDELCFEFVYPISLTDENGNTQTVNDNNALEAAFDAAENNDMELDFVYPFQIIMEGTTKTINTDEDFDSVLEDCDYFDDDDCECEHDEDEECFEVNFPITLIMPDGSNVVVNDEDEFETTIDNYYDNNPNDTGDVDVVYPFSVTLLEDDTVVIINNEAELDDLFEYCEYDFEDECFDFVYPLTVSFPDGSTATANDDDELETIFETWENNNPNAIQEPQLVFPVTIIYEDGNTETVQTEAELEELFEDCYDEYDDCDGLEGIF